MVFVLKISLSSVLSVVNFFFFLALSRAIFYENPLIDRRLAKKFKSKPKKLDTRWKSIYIIITSTEKLSEVKFNKNRLAFLISFPRKSGRLSRKNPNGGLL